MRKLKRALAMLPAIVAALACNLIETGSPTRIAPTPTRVVVAPLPTTFRPTIFPTFPSLASPVPRTPVPPGPTQQPPTGGLIPGCTLRADWRDTYVIQPYDTLSGIAFNYDLNTNELAVGNCLANPSLIFPGQVLRIPGGEGGIATGCSIPWFFSLNPGLTETGSCPFENVISSPASGQDFEGGHAYYYEAAASAYVLPMVYIAYGNGAFQQFTYRDSGPVVLPALTAPAGRVVPEGPIGRIWFENEEVRRDLGWAFAPASSFAGRRQRTLNGNVFFVDHGVRNTVLRVDLGRGTWVVGGSY
jgi:hypothetical protein